MESSISILVAGRLWNRALVFPLSNHEKYGFLLKSPFGKARSSFSGV